MQTLRHHGRSTAYRYREASDGSGPGIVCIHGSGGSHAVWKGQFELADRTSVAAVDLSGHGASEDIDADPGYETLEAYAEDVVAVIEATDCSVILGHSLGGAVALWAALEHDLSLDGLVLAGTSAKLAVLSDLLRSLETEFEQTVDFLHGPGRLFYDPEPALLDESKTRFVETGQAVTVRDFKTANRFDVRDRLHELTLPAAAIVGEYDRLTPLEYQRHFTAAMDCSLLRVENAAHLAMLEQPTAFNGAVSMFLDRLESDY